MTQFETLLEVLAICHHRGTTENIERFVAALAPLEDLEVIADWKPCVKNANASKTSGD